MGRNNDLPYKQGVTGSNPVGPTLIIKHLRSKICKCFFYVHTILHTFFEITYFNPFLLFPDFNHFWFFNFLMCNLLDNIMY
jgi:hypothetical protein